MAKVNVHVGRGYEGGRNAFQGVDIHHLLGQGRRAGHVAGPSTLVRRRAKIAVELSRRAAAGKDAIRVLLVEDEAPDCAGDAGVDAVPRHLLQGGGVFNGAAVGKQTFEQCLRGKRLASCSTAPLGGRSKTYLNRLLVFADAAKSRTGR